MTTIRKIKKLTALKKNLMRPEKALTMILFQKKTLRKKILQKKMHQKMMTLLVTVKILKTDLKMKNPSKTVPEKTGTKKRMKRSTDTAKTISRMLCTSSTSVMPIKTQPLRR